VTVAPNGTQTVTLTFTPANANENVTVVSSNTNIFALTEYGYSTTNTRTFTLTGITAGSGYIYVYGADNRQIKSFAVTVGVTYATNLTVPASVFVEAGKQYQITSTVTPANATAATWALTTPYTSSTPTGSYQSSVSSITSNGYLTATNTSGKATARATVQSGASKTITKDTAIYVIAVAGIPTSIPLSISGVGSKTQTVTPVLPTISGISYSYAYSSNNPSVATVSATGGVITGLTAGTAQITVTITVKAGSVTGTIVRTVAVTVTGQQPYPDSISLAFSGNTGNTLSVGETKTITVIKNPASSKYSGIRNRSDWSIIAGSIAGSGNVDIMPNDDDDDGDYDSATVKGVSAGKVTVEVEYSSAQGPKKAQITFDVVLATPTITITPNTDTYPGGSTVTLTANVTPTYIDWLKEADYTWGGITGTKSGNTYTFTLPDAATSPQTIMITVGVLDVSGKLESASKSIFITIPALSPIGSSKP
jgi:carbon monoxide dehydrogenase subunit G